LGSKNRKKRPEKGRKAGIIEEITMVKIEDSPAPLYAVSREELARLTQGVALDLLDRPLSIDLAPQEGARVRFHSVAEAERVRAYIA
jgi:hypothetical protein